MSFTMKDRSTEPFAWMIEGVDLADVAQMGAEEYVQAMAEQAIDGTGAGTTVGEWMSDSYEYEEAVRYIKEWIEENQKETL